MCMCVCVCVCVCVCLCVCVVSVCVCLCVTHLRILKMWRFMAAELNPALGRPRLADPKMVLRIRAGCVPIRTVMVHKTFIEKRVSAEADSTETLAVTHTVECKEVQVLLVSSNTFPSFWVLPSGGQRLPRAQVLKPITLFCVS